MNVLNNKYRQMQRRINKIVIIVIGLMSLCVIIVEAFRSEVIRGYPCVRRNNQLYCPTPRKNSIINISKNNSTLSSRSSLSTPSSTVYYRNTSTDSPHSSTLSSSSSSSSSSSTTSTYYMYYTKKSLDDDNDGDNSLHDISNADVEENIIDDGDQVLKRVRRERIDSFIDENKALIRRMFGEYNSPDDDDAHPDSRDHYATYSKNGQAIHKRPKRARSNSYTSNKVDSCESAVEIVTPYWASNSAGKIRAIVNTQHLQQAIQQEVCQSVQTKRCNTDCSCEQKYKWHRLLAYDPDDDCKGIFMDWFLFPSCCVCRCTKLFS